MTTSPRRITARKPERRRDVSGFDVVARTAPAASRHAPGSGFADWLTDDDPVEVTIDLGSSALDAEHAVGGERVVDVQIVLADDEVSS